MGTINEHIDTELKLAATLLESGESDAAFHHLERAHVLGQSITFEHTRIHWRMLRFALTTGAIREIFGQLFRIVGAATKTPFGIYPTGNTGGANVWFFKRMSIPGDLQAILEKTRMI